MPKVLSLLTLWYAIVVFTYAASAESDSEAQILYNDFTIDDKGNYEFIFETSNGITRKETGTIISDGATVPHLLVTGRYSYTDSEGKFEIVRYIADENGYRIDTESPRKPVIGLPPAVVASLLGK